MTYSWIQDGNWTSSGVEEQWWTVQGDYGAFHVYAFTMTMGVILAIAISGVRLYRRDVPLTELGIGAVIIVPISLFGASFFGKLNANGPGQNAGGASFFGLFAFWQGGMAIHGGVFAGTLVGIIIFYWLGRKTRVSVWVYLDCIVPNILIGQGVGRWGNFFNHEIFGRPVALWKDANGITTPALGLLPDFVKRNMVWRYSGTNGVELNGLVLETGQDYLMSPIFIYESLSLILVWVLITFVLPGLCKWFGKKPWKLHPNYFLIEESKSSIWRNEVFANHSRKDVELYKSEITKISEPNFIKRKWKEGKLLEKCNNPEGYTLLRAGVQFAAYFFAWNVVRFSIELGRPDDHLFLMYERTLSLTLIALTMMVGLIFAIIAQYIMPYLFRTPGWIYEQEYFYFDSADEEVNMKKSSESKIEKNKLKEQKAKEKLQKQLEKK